MILRTLGGLLVATATLLAQGPADFPPLANADIPGAPKLGSPTLLRGAKAPLAGAFHGLAAPAVFDWNGDGKKDLLLGEFETGPCGVRVYLNSGTNAAPRFSDAFSYAKTARDEQITIDSW